MIVWISFDVFNTLKSKGIDISTNDGILLAEQIGGLWVSGDIERILKELAYNQHKKGLDMIVEKSKHNRTVIYDADENVIAENYKFLHVDDLEGKQALCIKCQFCCRVLAFHVERHRIAEEFYAARGLEIEYDNATNRYFVTLPHVCPNLLPTGCSVYAQRPWACRIFDGRRHPATSKHCLWREL